MYVPQIYIYIYVYIYICVYIHIYIDRPSGTLRSLRIGIGSLEPFEYIYLYGCVCVCVYIYVYIHILRDLAKSVHWNGQFGTIRRQLQDGRLCVFLDQGKELSLKMKNLQDLKHTTLYCQLATNIGIICSHLQLPEEAGTYIHIYIYTCIHIHIYI